MQANLNPVIGTEQKGSRPVLVVSNEDYNQVVPNLTILPLTSTKRRLYPSEVSLPSGISGQPLDSIVMAHQIRTISKQRLEKLIGYLTDAKLRSEVRAAIKEHLDIE
ncbi:MAG: type II toxin-antitoxin system PemK/MazF family toxin [Dehalococcoidales bacterium]|nr:type II toxin-antitoxin system PemK/MazF family toxin [Dehalococcoidales bacterium]